MSKFTLALNTALAVFFLLFSTSCDDSAPSIGEINILMCIGIAGTYNANIQVSPGVYEKQVVKITNGCSFTATSRYSGVSTGSFTKNEGNTYYGSGTSPQGCGGTFDVVLVDKGNNIAYSAVCN